MKERGLQHLSEPCLETLINAILVLFLSSCGRGERTALGPGTAYPMPLSEKQKEDIRRVQANDPR